MTETKPSIAVAIPCYNEAVTINKVVEDFRRALPQAAIYVFDNNSRDDSAALAEQAGAQVVSVANQGKGHVLRAIFDTLEEDVLVLVDGDDTYPAEQVETLLAPILTGDADMVVGERLAAATDENMKPLHQVGNHLIVAFINRMFSSQYRDVLSGYRAFNRRFIEGVPVLTEGFEVETEITLQALAEELRVVEVPIEYRARPEDSQSKLRPFADGYRILLTAAIFLRDHRPLRFFGFLALSFWVLALLAIGMRLLGYFGIIHGFEALFTDLILLFVPSGLITLGIGLTLNTINTRYTEIKRLLQRSRKET